MRELIMLGTGNAVVTRCYNTCFTLNNDGRHLLIDAGGGNGILRQLELAQIPLNHIEGLMITHAHTDHILGCVWVVRCIAALMQKDNYEGYFSIYAHNEALHVLEWICRKCLPAKLTQLIGERIRLIELEDRDCFQCAGFSCQCFDIGSKKAKQFGFTVDLGSPRRLVCLGDEPLQESVRPLAAGAEWLIAEAFCLASQAHIFHPYEKHHSTARDAGVMAESLGVQNLVLYHTEDKGLDSRKASYTQEAAACFKSGRIFVPDDLERISLD